MTRLQRTPVVVKIFPFEQKRKGLPGIIHWIVIKFLNALPRKMAQFLFVLTSERGEETRTISDGAATFSALEVMCAFLERRKEGTATFSGWLWWTILDNARSVWNRFLLVKQELRRALLETARQKGSVRFLSIGSGSARSVIETVASLEETISLETMLLDQDAEAIQYSKKLAGEFNLNHIKWVKGEFFRLRKHCGEFRPNVVELVGLLDYLDHRKAVLFLKMVFQILSPGGILITGNITPNLERPFVEKGVRWPPMVHREEKDLIGLLKEAGFKEIRSKREPLKIHIVAVARKPQESMVS